MADRLERGYTEISPQTVLDIAENLASLNEMVSALISGLALGDRVDDDWSRLAFETLREHNWRLGFEFNEERPPDGWHDADVARRLSP